MLVILFALVLVVIIGGGYLVGIYNQLVQVKRLAEQVDAG